MEGLKANLFRIAILTRAIIFGLVFSLIGVNHLLTEHFSLVPWTQPLYDLAYGLVSKSFFHSETAPAPFDDLPNELLIHIFRSFDFDAGEYLWNVCLVNRRFNELATPILYERYSSVLGAVGAFSNTLVLKPVLARRVKIIHWNMHLEAIANRKAGPETKAKARRIWIPNLMLQLSALNPPFATDMLVRFQYVARTWEESWYINEIWEDYFTMLLMLSPSIERLTIDGGTRPNSSAWGQWYKPIQHWTPHRFRQLRNLTFIEAQRTTHVVELRTMFCIGTLRHLHIQGKFSFEGTEAKDVDVPPAVLEIEHLRILACNTSSEVVRWILTRCQALKSFQYESLDLKEEKDKMSWEMQIGNALDGHKESLERLTIIRGAGDPDPGEPGVPVMTFHDFSALRHLKVSHLEFTDSGGKGYVDVEIHDLTSDHILNILPPNMEILELIPTFMSHLYYLIPAIFDSVVVHGRKRLPLLKEVRFTIEKNVCPPGVDAFICPVDWKQLDWKVLGERLENIGVKLVVDPEIRALDPGFLWVNSKISVG